MTQVLSIQPTKIIVGKRLRTVDDDRVEFIAASILDGKQIQPITTRLADKNGKYVLIDGLHRLAACIKLGCDVDILPKDVSDEEAELMEIDATLINSPLTALARCEFLAKRKALYEKRHPETKNGAQGGRGGQRNENGILPFSKDTAERVGLSQSTIERAVAVANKLSPEVKEALQGTPLEDKRADLELLAKEPRDRQKKIIKALLAKKDAPTTVKAAIERIDGAVTKADLSDDDKKFQALLAKWGKCSKKVQDRFLAEIGAVRTGGK